MLTRLREMKNGANTNGNVESNRSCSNADEMKDEALML